jgi:hypothetical protein
MENGHTLIALYWLLRHCDRLCRLWAVPWGHPGRGRRL